MREYIGDEKNKSPIHRLFNEGEEDIALEYLIQSHKDGFKIIGISDEDNPMGFMPEDFIDTIYRDKEDVLFVVSHGTTIRTIVMNFFHYSPEWYSNEPTPGNCSIRLIESNDRVNSEHYIYNAPKPKVFIKK